ncbi:MAG: 4-hydroxy-3-methylbut-2-en-1-yl diphosphate synthase [Bacteroidetes bacterium]|nr:MAG: 4-hydroxy-3-methylbut-2-en-1-yl diphosphate synthase [Bacteroidota bacterium]
MERRQTIEVRVGNIGIGGSNPVRVQTMTNTDTNDIEGSVEQIKRCVAAGAEIIRLTTQGEREVNSVAEIKRRLAAVGIVVPLVADVHFSSSVALKAACVVDKVRINPGNFIKPIKKDFTTDYTDEEFEQERLALRERFVEFLDVCKKHHTAVRIGVNHGSLGERMMNRYGDTPMGMAESCLELLRMCRQENFDQIVISLKASNTVLMIEAVKLLVEKMDAEDFHFPLHLGVTEAGDGEDGRIKSAVGIGSLLAVGIGDTIRVSLSEPPEAEIPVAFGILQATRSRITKTEYISCPSCGRTLFDLQTAVRRVRERTSHLVGLKIAVMGCIVNGPGEMADADYGYVGAGKGKISLYKGKTCVERNIPEDEAVDKLLALIDRYEKHS